MPRAFFLRQLSHSLSMPAEPPHARIELSLGQPALVLRCEAVTAARLSEIRTIIEAAIAQAVAP